MLTITFFDILPHLIAPIIVVVLLILARFGMDKKSINIFAGSYFWGILTVIPTAFIIYMVNNYWLTHVQSIRRILFYGFILIGFFVEFFKFLLLRFKYIPKPMITKPFDGILFAIMISLGFSTGANIYFAFEWNFTNNLQVVLYTLPFANMLFAIILGFFVGMGKFRINHVDSLTGFGAAFLFQGFYNFCLLSQDYLLLGLVGLGTLIISLLLCVKSLNTDTKGLL